MEQITISGNLGADAEVKQQNGDFVMNFSVAVNDDYKNEKGEKVSRTNWYRVSSWSKKEPKLAEWMLKGSKVIVQGRPKPNHYVNEDTKKTVSTIDIIATDIELLSSTKEAK